MIVDHDLRGGKLVRAAIIPKPADHGLSSGVIAESQSRRRQW
jgi:hypothetical protein